MKYLICFFLLCFTQNIYSQLDETEDVFWDLIDMKLFPEVTTEIGYVQFVDQRMGAYFSEKFENDSTNTYYKYLYTKQKNHQYTKQKIDSISLTKNEKEYLISELNDSQKHEWNLSKENDLKIVDFDNILQFLKDNRLRELKTISKPIFIRNNSICLVYNQHLCCGEIMGNSNLSFFKKKDGKWTKWITISHGDY